MCSKIIFLFKFFFLFKCFGGKDKFHAPNLFQILCMKSIIYLKTLYKYTIAVFSCFFFLPLNDSPGIKGILRLNSNEKLLSLQLKTSGARCLWRRHFPPSVYLWPPPYWLFACQPCSYGGVQLQPGYWSTSDTTWWTSRSASRVMFRRAV